MTETETKPLTSAPSTAAASNKISSSSVFSLKALVALVVVISAAVSIFRKSPESIVSDISTYANTIAKTSSYASPKTYVERTGVDLHLSVCGETWDEYYAKLPEANSAEQSHHAFQWTVSGGEEYKLNAGIIMEKWRTLGLDPLLVIALDEETAKAVCDYGFAAVHWSAKKGSYSRVADAKFAVARFVAEKGYRGFFIEMDIFCRKNPVPKFFEYVKEGADLVNVGHGDVGYFVNIGSFMAAPRMAPFFHGLQKVLAYSKDTREHTNQANWSVDFFDQNIYQHCLPVVQQNMDDDADPAQFEYYLYSDEKRKNDLLHHCQKFHNFTHRMIPHHVMSSHDPPTIYDSTHCIHPLASFPFTPLAFKMGTAKFYGWDPKPIGPDERLLKLYAGDLEFANCWNWVINHEQKRMDDFTGYDKMGMFIAAMIEIAVATNRTLVLPQYLRSKDAWAVPIHAMVDVRTLGVPYRSLTREQSFELEAERETMVVTARYNFSDTFRRTTSDEYADVPVLAIHKICNVRDYKLEVLEERKSTMKFCFDKDMEWTRAMGAWMDFCQGSE